MKFKTDENMPVEVAQILAQHEHDALSVIDQKLAGHPDRELASVCRAEQRAFVTLDLDFADVRVYPPSQYAGLIVLRPRAQNIPAIERLAEQMVQYLVSEPLAGHLWIVEEQRVRIREGGASGSP
jgi:predicted nuclease of predicted toxin-antitoxin system